MPPRHQVVAHLIQRSIVAGDLVPGQVLPPDDELARRCNASPAELRLAIAHLRSLGLVSSDAAHGNMVSNPPTQSHITSMPGSYLKQTQTQDSQFRESASEVGLVATREAEAHVESASAEIADRLHLEVGQQVVHLRTVRHTNAGPAEIDNTYYPCDLVGTETAAVNALTDDFLHGLGWIRLGWEDAITTRIATETEAARLGIDATSPVIDRARLRYARSKEGHARPVSYTHSVLVGGRNRLIYSGKQGDVPPLQQGAKQRQQEKADPG